MSIFFTTLHVIVCLVLIVVVLLQHGKGADMGAILGGGGSNTVFGSRGAGNFLTKLTTACAILFMVTSMALSYIKTSGSDVELFETGYEEPLHENGAAGAIDAPTESEADALEEIPTGLEEIPQD